MSPSRPIFLTWYRYMPVMPTRARAPISIFKELRIAHSAGWTPATVSGGWFSWTAMKMVPAATAARPADRVSVVGVTFMSGPVSSVLAKDSGCLEPRGRPCDPASHDDVTDMVICELSSLLDPRPRHRKAWPAGGMSSPRTGDRRCNPRLAGPDGCRGDDQHRAQGGAAGSRARGP